jgi:aryl-alcohol dehydrogenase-like predicted oxidoreductase
MNKIKKINLINKFIIGLAQSDPNYGISKKNNFTNVFNLANKFGFTFFDTAEKYKGSEIFLKKIKNKKKTKITSKLSFADRLDKNLKRKVQASVDEILNKNELENIYGILIHDPLLPLNLDKWPIIYKCLLKLKKKKTIKKIGISVYSRFELDQILKIFTPDIVQFPLNVFDQSFNDIKYLRSLKIKKIELHARSIFLQGILLKNFKKYKYFIKWEDSFKKWNNFLKINKLSNLNACLKFVLQNTLIDKFIIGLGNKNHFNEFISELKVLNKGLGKDHDFSKLHCDDNILTDPRYWNSSSII